MNNLSFNESGSHVNSDINLASVCGLYCGACGIYLATQENDADKILRYAVVLNQSFDETLCDGCRAERKSKHCAKMCSFITCATDRGIEFCGSCNEYPCKELSNFQSKMPHRIELFESQSRIREIGSEKWKFEMHEKFSCPNCNAINSAYDIACRKCNNIPSCKFVDLHVDIIDKHLSRK